MTGGAGRSSVAVDCHPRRSTTTGVRSTRSFRQSRGCGSSMRIPTRTSPTANWLEIGWALRPKFWGHGYASEIGQAGLAFAFDDLEVKAVVSCTVRHNARSRAVMERIAMRYPAKSAAAAWSKGLKGCRSTPRSLSMCCYERTGTRPLQVLRSLNERLELAPDGFGHQRGRK